MGCEHLRVARTASRVQHLPAAAAGEARKAALGLRQACHGPAPDWELLPGAPVAKVQGGARLPHADRRRFPNAEAGALHNCAPWGGTLWGGQPLQGSHGGAQGPVQNEPQGLLVAGHNGPGRGSLCDGPKRRHSPEPVGPPLGCLAPASLVAGPTGSTSLPGQLSGRYDPLGRPPEDLVLERGAVPAWPGLASGSEPGLWAGEPFSPETPAGGACGTSARTAQVAPGSGVPGLPATGVAGSPTAQPDGRRHAADPGADPAGLLPPIGALGAAVWPPLDLDWVGLLAMDLAPVECSTAGGAGESAMYGTPEVEPASNHLRHVRLRHKTTREPLHVPALIALQPLCKIGLFPSVFSYQGQGLFELSGQAQCLYLQRMQTHPRASAVGRQPFSKSSNVVEGALPQGAEWSSPLPRWI